ncbi:MAG: hypothetical protein QMD00_02180 [Hadesarchaea archaeon]|nr:hypothetical protein [Hadesarchaea archaeon]
MKFRVKQVAFDFLFGGALVAGALLAAALLGPTAGGILAGAPIRTSGVVALHYIHNRDLGATTEMTRGVVMAMISNVFFAISLYLAIPRLGIVGGFLAASLVFVLAVLALSQLVPWLK